MPWGEKTVEKKREDFIADCLKPDRNMSRLCREYGISRKVGYKWLNRYKQEQCLADRSKKPHTIPSKTEESKEKQIIDLRKENPGWGAKKLRDVLISEGNQMPCIRTVSNILNHNGLILLEDSQARQPFKRFERDECNELWQSDFKGEFMMSDGNKCFPLTILDDHSRFSIKIDPKLDMKGVTDSFRQAFYEFGLPDSLLTDNGACFAGFKGGYTKFERFLMDQDVLPIHGRFAHPQTQGKIERFHRSMKDELLKYQQFSNIDEAKLCLQEWREKYNNVRPHEALGNKRPAQVYQESNRLFEDIVKPYDYGSNYHMCKINNWGYLRYEGFRVYLSETFADTNVQLRACDNEDAFIVCYRNFCIAKVDAAEGKLINRKAYRMHVSQPPLEF